MLKDLFIGRIFKNMFQETKNIIISELLWSLQDIFIKMRYIAKI